MKAGEKTGNFKTYDSAGHLLLDGYFMGGKLHGTNLAYYPTGELRHRYEYKEGKRIGSNYDYYKHGAVSKKETVALNGIDTREETFDSLGLPVHEKSLRNQRAEGTWLFYFPGTRQVQIREEYEKAKLHGVRITYYPSGQKSLEETYQFNLITGPVRSYDEQGHLKWEAEYRANRQHGVYTAYFPNGKIQEQGQYVANKKHNEWKTFDAQGNLSKTELFRAGILQKKP
jgi:antitoxin component YwqK of YwqJK toxin-antitoxin module